MDQLSGLKLTSIQYLGTNIGSQFTLSLTIGADTTTIPLTISQGITTTFDELLTAKSVTMGSSSWTAAVSANVQRPTPPGGSGNATANFNVDPNVSSQAFNLNVTVSNGSGQNATLRLGFASAVRVIPPFSATVDYPCEWPAIAQAWTTWLCMNTSVPNFATLPEIVELGTVMSKAQSTFSRTNTALNLAYASPSSGFMSWVDYTIDSLSAAVMRKDELSWRYKWLVGDIQDAIDLNLVPYVERLVNLNVLVPAPDSLCYQWWELLHCYCRICANRSALSVDVNNYYDANAAPLVANLYATARDVAVSENLSLAYPAGMQLQDQCAKIRYILNLFDRRCRGRMCVSSRQPANDSALATALGPMVPVRTQLQQMLAQLGVYLCTPTFTQFCAKWNTLYGCLKKFCDNRSQMSQDVLDDFESTFGSLIRNLYRGTRGAALSVQPGISNTCAYLSAINSFFTYVCPSGYLPNYAARFATIDGWLNSLQTLLNSFTAEWVDFCSSTVSVPTTYCTDWLNILACLRHLCSKKFVADGALLDAFKNGFNTAVDGLYSYLYPNIPPTVTDPGPLGVDVLCYKLGRIEDYLNDICGGTHLIDPFTKLRLDHDLALFQQAMTTLATHMSDMCQTTVTISGSDCDNWRIILTCLNRFCGMKRSLHPVIVDQVVNLFGQIVDEAYWLSRDPSGSYKEPTEFSVDDMCMQVSSLLDFFNEICADRNIDPFLKRRLDALLADFQTAYPQLQAILSGICTVDTSCEDWAEMLECLIKLCARSGEVSQSIINDFLEDFSSEIDDVYHAVFGSYPAYPAGSLDRLCVELNELSGVVLGGCGAGGSVILDELGQVSIIMPEPELDAAMRAYLAARIAVLMPRFRNLQSALLNAGILGGPFICGKIDVDCAKIRHLPQFLHLLCCAPQGAGFAQLAPIQNLNTWLTDITPLIGMIEVRLGLNPPDELPSGSDLCHRLRQTFRILLQAFANPAALTALNRYQLRFYYDRLAACVTQYALLVKDAPRGCDCCADTCDKWNEMLSRLCCMCNNGDLPGTAALCAKIAALFNHAVDPEVAVPPPSALTTLVVLHFDPETASCCERLAWLVQAFGVMCLQCDRALYDMYRFDDYYDGFRTAYDAFIASLPQQGAVVCGDSCSRWIEMFECIVTLGLRKNELPGSLNTQITSLLSTVVTNVHIAIRGAVPLPDAMPAANPLPNVLDTVYWNATEVLRGLYWLCSPYSYWSPGARAALAAQLTAMEEAYGTMVNLLNDSWVPICNQKFESACARLRAIPEWYRTLCGSGQPTGSAITTIGTLLTWFHPELDNITAQLSIQITAPANNASFCSRLSYALAAVATAYARLDELSPRHRLMVRFFWGIFESQAIAYRSSPGGASPQASTPIGTFRDNWLEILGCICATCDRVAAMSPAERGNISGVITALANALGGVSDLYDAIVPIASQAGMPFSADPCVEEAPCGPEDDCRKLRNVIAFFAGYCLGCKELTDQTVDAVTMLSGRLTSIRALVVALRSALAKAHLNTCPERDAGLEIIQSDYLYLQAAGSDGDTGDGSAAGVHLRWALLDEVGAKHLPKGNLAAPGAPYEASYGFNRADDFVKIHRTPYKESERYGVTVDPVNDAPTKIMNIGIAVMWLYEPSDARAGFLVTDTDFPENSRTPVALRFLGVSAYNTLAQGRNPIANATDRQFILDNYTGLLEVETVGRPFFRLHVTTLQAGTNPLVLVEGVSQIDSSRDVKKLSRVLTTRKQISGSTGTHDLFMENVRFARMRFDRCHPRLFTIETYHDYYYAVDRRYGWRHLGDFALSISDIEVRKRLEDTSRFTVHTKWPKFNDTPPSPNNLVEKLNVCNYWERWRAWTDPQTPPYPSTSYGCTTHNRREGDSLVDAVTAYLHDSMQANNWNPVLTRPALAEDNQVNISIGVLDALNVVSQDFHIARMLGLGYIDWEMPALPGGRDQLYIYAAEYVTGAPLDSGAIAKDTLHRFLSLPTSQATYRLPVKPEWPAPANAVKFGLEPENQDAQPYTDNEGYANYGDGRFIRLYKDPLVFDIVEPDEYDPATFFNGAQFSRADSTRPVQYGVRYYRRQGTTFTEVLPAISNDMGEDLGDGYIPFCDRAVASGYPNGYPEPIGIPEPGAGKPLFVHHIVKPHDAADVPTVEGWHKYGIYGINWFSRISSENRMNDVDAFETRFPKRNTLLPPLNLTAQYIQKEKQPMFTSVAEQADIEHLEHLTRVTFEWNHTNNIAYQTAKYAEFFFRDTPTVIKGKVKGDPVPINGDTELRVTVEEYVDYSARNTGGRKTIPALPGQSYAQRFVGSTLVTKKGRFIVVSVSVDTTPISGADTRHRITSLIVKRDFRYSDNGAKTWVDPLKGEYFIVAENMNGSGTWTAIPGTRINLKTFPDGYTETEVGNDGREITLTVGGILAPATNEHMHEIDENVPEGIYRVRFGGDILSPYDDPTNTNGANVHSVEWYCGTARIPAVNGENRAMQVIRIVMAAGSEPTTIYVFDPITASGGAGLQQGEGIAVNFHPGYRAYLNLPAAGIDRARIEPASDELSRSSVIVARSVDSDYQMDGANYHSALTSPAVHMARQTNSPMKPGTPHGPAFASRPDLYAKSTYSFDTVFATMDDQTPRTPYGMVFYRANQLDLLRALYAPTTVRNILAMMPLRETDTHFLARWRGLVSFDHDAGSTHFKDYGDGFFFPAPDNPEFSAVDQDHPNDPEQIIYPFTLGRNLDQIMPYLDEVFDTVLYPLTERPVMYNTIAVDENLITSNAKPIVRDVNGELLDLSDPGFNPAPMIRRRAAQDGGEEIRFTDYTLDGDTTDFYFYCARELDETLRPGPLSDLSGPIRLVNSRPCAPPVIRRVNVQLDRPISGSGAQVIIEITPYLLIENVIRLRLYRTYDKVLNGSIRTMDMVGEFDYTTFAIDSFSSQIPQYGSAIYYRVVACRAIINEHSETEYIPSSASDLVITNVVDARVPNAPTITHSPADPGADMVYETLTLSWPQTTYKGTYYLYRLDQYGNWVFEEKFGQPIDPNATLSKEYENVPKEVDGVEVFHRFKVVAENTSGIRNNVENIHII